MKKGLLSLFILGFIFTSYSFADCYETCDDLASDGLVACDLNYPNEFLACDEHNSCEDSYFGLQSCDLNYYDCQEVCLGYEECLESCSSEYDDCVSSYDGTLEDYESCMEEYRPICQVYESCVNSVEDDRESCNDTCDNQGGGDTPVIPDNPGDNPGGDSGNSGLIPGGVSSLSGTFLQFTSTVAEFIPYIVYISLGILGAIIGFYAIRWLVNWIRKVVFSSFK